LKIYLGFKKKTYKIRPKVVALTIDLWYHLPVLFFLIFFETTFKYSDLAKIAIPTAPLEYGNFCGEDLWIME